MSFVVGSVPGEPMGGWEAAKGYVTTYLQTNLAATNLAVREILGIPAPSVIEDLLPDPDLIIPFEPPALDAATLATSFVMNASALIYVSCLQTLSVAEVNISDGGDPFYDTTYPINVVGWVKGHGWENTITARNNLNVSTRICLFRDFGLGLPEVLRWDVNSIRERGNDPEVMRGDRHLAGFVMSFNLIVR